MRSISFVALAFAVAGCAPLGLERAYAKTSDLPAQFHLECSVPRPVGNQLPKDTKDGFKLEVDLPARKFSIPWREGQWPLKEVKETKIVFIDYYVQRGLDNNPMEAKMSFDVPSGEPTYRSIASARIRLDRSFTAKCKIVDHA